MPPGYDEDIQSYKAAADCLLPMGITSENVAREFGVSRSKQVNFVDELCGYIAQLTKKSVLNIFARTLSLPFHIKKPLMLGKKAITMIKRLSQLPPKSLMQKGMKKLLQLKWMMVLEPILRKKILYIMQPSFIRILVLKV